MVKLHGSIGRIDGTRTLPRLSVFQILGTSSNGATQPSGAVLMGPAKLSLLQAWTPGPDRRNGILIGKQPAAFVYHNNYDRRLGNHVLFQTRTVGFSPATMVQGSTRTLFPDGGTCETHLSSRHDLIMRLQPT